MGNFFLKVLLLSLILNSCSTTVNKKDTIPKNSTNIKNNDNSISNNKNNNSITNKETSTIKPKPNPIFYMPGFTKGDTFSVDGPLWFDGDGKVNEFNENSLILNLKVLVPPFPEGYKTKDSKINIELRINKDNSKYSFAVKDLNSNLLYKFKNMTLTTGKTEANFFSQSKPYINIKNDDEQYNFLIQDTGIILLNISSFPGDIILKNNNLK